MAGEWKNTTLGECAEWLSGGTPFKGNEAFWSGRIPWVSAKDMKSFRLHDAEDHISPLAIGKGGKLIPAGTILLLVRGMTLHNDVPICMTTKEMAFNQDIKALLPAKNVDGTFLAYWLLANKPDLLTSVDHAGHGTGRLVTDTLKAKLVQLPPLSEQKAIASILGALDDKIELNHRMNATLESMARALFQSWFVDFDPVRAKLDGRAPAGMDEATAGLFPSAFHETKIGPIPIGWEAGRLLDLCNLKRGHDLPTNTRMPGPIPVISSSGISGFHSETNVRGPGVVTGRYGTIGKVFFVETDYWPLNTSLYVDDFKGNPPRYVFHLLGEVNFANYTDKAAVPGVNRNHLHEEPTVIPRREVRQAFARAVVPLWSQHRTNEQQSSVLATLRDTLLPKLLSGGLIAGNEQHCAG